MRFKLKAEAEGADGNKVCLWAHKRGEHKGALLLVWVFEEKDATVFDACYTADGQKLTVTEENAQAMADSMNRYIPDAPVTFSYVKVGA